MEIYKNEKQRLEEAAEKSTQIIFGMIISDPLPIITVKYDVKFHHRA